MSPRTPPRAVVAPVSAVPFPRKSLFATRRAEGTATPANGHEPKAKHTTGNNTWCLDAFAPRHHEKAVGPSNRTLRDRERNATRKRTRRQQNAKTTQKKKNETSQACQNMRAICERAFLFCFLPVLVFFLPNARIPHAPSLSLRLSLSHTPNPLGASLTAPSTGGPGPRASSPRPPCAPLC